MSAVTAAVVALGIPAWAYFTSTSTTVSPTVSAASVNAPAVTVTTINSTATLNWTAPTLPSGASFTYTVARTVGGGSLAAACTGNLSTTTCTDSGLTVGTSY